MNTLKPKLVALGIIAVFFGAIWVLAGVFPNSQKQVPSFADQKGAQYYPSQPQNNAHLDVFSGQGAVKEEIKGNDSIISGPISNLKEIVDPFKPITGPLSHIQPVKPKTPALTEAEAFHQIFPNSYLAKLTDLQSQLIKIKWMSDSQSAPLDSDERVLSFLSNAVDALIKNGAYPNDEYRKLARNATTVEFPKFVRERKAYLMQQASLWKPLNMFDPPPILGYESNFSRVMKDIFPFIDEANAQGINVAGIWETSPTCFKGIIPSWGLKGKDLYGFCCNCGIKCYGYFCYYVPDCGPFAKQNGGNNALCDIHLGCLNMTCDGYYNAIWDGADLLSLGGSGQGYSNFPNYTFKCGCDDPDKQNQDQNSGTDDSSNSNSSDGGGGYTGNSDGGGFSGQGN